LTYPTAKGNKDTLLRPSGVNESVQRINTSAKLALRIAIAVIIAVIVLIVASMSTPWFTIRQGGLYRLVYLDRYCEIGNVGHICVSLTEVLRSGSVLGVLTTAKPFMQFGLVLSTVTFALLLLSTVRPARAVGILIAPLGFLGSICLLRVPFLLFTSLDITTNYAYYDVGLFTALFAGILFAASTIAALYGNIRLGAYFHTSPA
jgi:hypothetical protein